MKLCALLPLVPLLLGLPVAAQTEERRIMDPAVPRELEIGGLTVSGTTTVDVNAVMLFSGLKVGQTVTLPGPRIADAIRNIWEQKLFSDVRIELAEVRGRTAFLNIVVTEMPRLSRFKFEGVTKSDADKLRERMELARGQQVNEGLLTNTRGTIRSYYVEKGFLKADAEIEQRTDSLMENSVLLIIHVKKGRRVRIKDVVFKGNEALTDAKLRRAMKKTRRRVWYNPFASSKFLAKEYRVDKENLIDTYNEKGYRNAAIVRDTTWFVNDRRLMVEIEVEEDRRFHFREVRFSGNTKHSDRELLDILNIKRGDVYNKKVLDSRMYMNQTGRDISSLYMDDGYLSFYPEVIEVAEGDSIDLDIRLREGKQYRVRSVLVKGNTKTNEHVIRREIRTKPGQLFNRSDVLRTQRELANLGYFDPEKLGVNPLQDARTGTVDLEYTVEEKPSDRLELSGGWGAGRLVLSLGLSFTNFSLRNITKPEAWQPLPAGDGQTLNLRAQTNGRYFQSYSLSFVEPWLGGRKPNALSVSAFHSAQTNGERKYVETEEGRVINPQRQSLLISGGSVGLGKRLTWPDDYFLLRQNISYQLYDLRNWNQLFAFNNGQSNVLAYQVQLSRNSVDQPFFARSGSDITLSLKATPPYSWFQPGRDFASEPADRRYNWAEFHKWKFTTQWFTRITRSKSGHDLVLMTRAGFGFLGRYSKNLGNSPFERFYLGGSALTGFQLDGREIVGLRGYDDLSLAPNTGNFLINKYTAELRFPISLNPSATIYMLTFAEAGNTWGTFDRYDPFRLYRSAGVGLRLFLPMFGPMGLDYGWRFDDVPDQPAMAPGQFHFTIGIDLGEL
ncbi:MAG: outer membrane protein assembly factor BamA [Flavobacteriales bacterium]|nr:Outer membrane protein assembly factor BamA [Flavobacteriales bacterium]MCC6577937.1 outer membrane protein assembly factor BamA [Flavobacteriales bacterium]NUQ14427.1 outer membrane protein assembly factor BamA [Flavobacteriales bacterium]